MTSDGGGSSGGVATASFALGSFWGAEMLFRRQQDVLTTQVGFMGGTTKDPTFEEVAAGGTGHTEVVQITFTGPYETQLERFWNGHDPTARNRFDPRAQGPLRSSIFFHSREQERAAQASLAEVQTRSDRPVLTPIVPASAFWAAADEHQQFFEKRSAYVPYRTQPTDSGRSSADDDVDELAKEFGQVFRHTCSAYYLHMALLQETRHYEAARDGLRRWIAACGSRPREFELDWVRIVGLDTAAAAEMRVAGRCSEYTFWVNFRPGNFAPWSSRGSFPLTETRASVDARTGDTTYGSSGYGSYSSSHDWYQVDGNHRGPIELQDPDDREGSRWWAHIPPASIEVGCGAASSHTLRWERGGLRDDAGEGVEQERTLGALGAERCPCATLALAWDPILYLSDWRRTIAGPMTSALDTGVATARVGCAASTWTADVRKRVLRVLRRPGLAKLPVASSTLVDLESLPSVQQRAMMQLRESPSLLPIPMRVRWLLSMMHWLHERRRSHGSDDALQLQEWVMAAVRHPTMALLWQWCRSDPAITYGHIVCRLLDDNEPPRAEGHLEGDAAFIAVSIPFRWVTHVWGRGMAIVDDHLVLDVAGTPNASEVDCSVVSWDDRGDGTRLVTRQVTAKWDGDQWHFTPDP